MVFKGLKDDLIASHLSRKVLLGFLLKPIDVAIET